MKAAVLHALGEAPSYEGFAEPTPNKDEALVSVKAASLKNSDKMMADGSHYDSRRQLPAVVGLDGSGGAAGRHPSVLRWPSAALRDDGGEDRRAENLLPAGTGCGGRSDGSGLAKSCNVVVARAGVASETGARRDRADPRRDPGRREAGRPARQAPGGRTRRRRRTSRGSVGGIG